MSVVLLLKQCRFPICKVIFISYLLFLVFILLYFIYFICFLGDGCCSLFFGVYFYQKRSTSGTEVRGLLYCYYIPTLMSPYPCYPQLKSSKIVYGNLNLTV